MQYAVLLGGVNVGGRTIKSDELKKSFVKGGFRNPQTVLASGNVVIESQKSAAGIKSEVESFLFKDFKFRVRVFVIPFDKLKRLIAVRPFHTVGPEYHQYLIFRENEEEADLSELQMDDNTEAVLQSTGIIYWRVLKGFTLESPFARYLAKLSRKEFTTTRNVNTLIKILAKK